MPRRQPYRCDYRALSAVVLTLVAFLVLLALLGAYALHLGVHDPMPIGMARPLASQGAEVSALDSGALRAEAERRVASPGAQFKCESAERAHLEC